MGGFLFSWDDIKIYVYIWHSCDIKKMHVGSAFENK